MIENELERQRRLEAASQSFLEKRFGPDGLIPGISFNGAILPEDVVENNPLENAVYDALIYLREGMSRQEVLGSLLIRNKISKIDAEKIIDQVIEQTNKQTNKQAIEPTTEPNTEQTDKEEERLHVDDELLPDD